MLVEVEEDQHESPASSERLERIVWVDSGLSYASTWLDTADIIDRAKRWNGQITSVGQIIHEDDNCVVLGISYDGENDNWASAFLIYKGAILKREKLQAPDS